jgi:hypothetical protein
MTMDNRNDQRFSLLSVLVTAGFTAHLAAQAPAPGNIRPTSLQRPADLRLPDFPDQTTPLPGTPRLLPDAMLLNPAGSKIPQDIIEDTKLSKYDLRYISTKFAKSEFGVYCKDQLIQNCGINSHVAEQLATLLREMQLSHHGEVAGATPKFDYWLKEIKGPDLRPKLVATEPQTKEGLGLVKLDTSSLSAVEITKVWVVRDNNRVLYNFGRDKAAALEALEIIKKYGFDAICPVGQPKPVMMLLVKTPEALKSNKNPQEKTAGAESVLRFIGDGFHLPGHGYVAKLEPLARTREVVRGQQWQIEAAGDAFMKFGNDEAKARQTHQAFKDWGITSSITIGQTGLKILLVNNRAPRGTPFTMQSQTFRMEELSMVSDNGIWEIRVGKTRLAAAGPNQKDAELLVEALKHLKVDAVVACGAYPIFIQVR